MRLVDLIDESWMRVARTRQGGRFCARLCHAGRGPPDPPIEMIAPGTPAPEFTLDSHQDETIKSADFAGKKNMLLVFYPLDFTPT